MSVAVTERYVTFNRRRYLQTYRNVAFILKLLCCIATGATFLRICEQYQLPLVFLALPALLFVVAIFCQLSPINEGGIVAVVVGASTGAISGFVSAVVDHGRITTYHAPSSASRSSMKIFICSLEFLHIPVLTGAIMYTFCLLFTRLPPVLLIVIAVATAACGTIIFGLILTIIHDPVFAGIGTGVGTGFNILEWSSYLFFFFIVVFVLALMPMLRTNKRAWLVCFMAIVVSTQWQLGFLDSLQWDWEQSYFPVPSALVSIVILFMIDIVQMTEAADVAGKRHSSRMATDSHILDANGPEILSSSITWHAGAYIVERTSLTFILESRRSRTKLERRYGSDVWLCSLAMIGFVSMFSPAGIKLFPLFTRNCIVCLGLILYVCLTLTSGILANGYFIDDILGLALLATTSTSDFAA